MPIAICFTREPALPSAVEGLVALWSEESGVRAEHMTINVSPGIHQAGARYAVMAFLYLPSLWGSDEVRRLQVGLASALAGGLEVPVTEVHVITSVVESGYVVEDGETQQW